MEKIETIETTEHNGRTIVKLDGFETMNLQAHDWTVVEVEEGGIKWQCQVRITEHGDQRFGIQQMFVNKRFRYGDMKDANVKMACSMDQVNDFEPVFTIFKGNCAVSNKMHSYYSPIIIKVSERLLAAGNLEGLWIEAWEKYDAFIQVKLKKTKATLKEQLVSCENLIQETIDRADALIT